MKKKSIHEIKEFRGHYQVTTNVFTKKNLMTENSYVFTGWSCWVAKGTRIFGWCEKVVSFGYAMQAKAGLRRPKCLIKQMDKGQDFETLPLQSQRTL